MHRGLAINRGIQRQDYFGDFAKWRAWKKAAGYTIRYIRCDNGTEIKNFKLPAIMECTSLYSPESDCIAAHQTILTMANTLQFGAGLEQASW
jgi:hypothetical protein